MSKPPPSRLLIFAYGNPSRGDDALGPELLKRIEATTPYPGLELLTDFQLQVEHAMDLCDRDLVLFADASLSASPPWELTRIQPADDISYTTHSMSPQAVMNVYQRLYGAPPPCYLLSIRGYAFALGEPLSAPARSNLDQAVELIEGLLKEPGIDHWELRLEFLD